MIKKIKRIVLFYKTVVENVISLFSIRLFEYGLSFITLPYLVRVLGPEYFGLLALSQGVIQYFILFTDYGFNLTGPRNIAKSKTELEKGERFSAIFFGKVFLGFIATGIFLGLFYFVQKWNEKFMLYCIIYLNVIGNIMFPIWFFQGIEKMRYITIVNLIARSISAVSVFMFVNTQADYMIAAFLQSVTPVIAGFFSFWILYHKYRYVFVAPNISKVKLELKDGWHVFISTIAINLYTASNIVILGMFAGTTIVGYFSVAQKVIASVNGLISPISQAIYPYVSKLADRSKKETMHFLQRCMLLLCGGNFLASITIFFCTEKIVEILFGNDYRASIDVLRIMSFLPFIISLSNVFGIQTMLPFGMQSLFSRIVILSAILNTLFVFPLAYYYQGIGVAIAMVGTECFVTISMWYVLNNRGFKFLNDYI